jgi:hypothetical protein
VYNGHLAPDQYRISFYANPESGEPPVRGAWTGSLTYLITWTTMTVSFQTPNWTEGQLANAVVIVQSRYNSNQFFVDDLSVSQDTTEKYLYRQLLSNASNPFGTPNANGIYHINCNGQTLVIERSRIVGTLVVTNPGPNSRIGNAPLHWAPHLPGYPALLVNGNFQIQATNADLSEATHFTNFNPAGTPYVGVNPTTDADVNDVYPWSQTLRGLIGINGNLVYQNTPRITGRVIVSGSTTNAANYQYTPEALLSPPPQFRSERYAIRRASVRREVDP